VPNRGVSGTYSLASRTGFEAHVGTSGQVMEGEQALTQEGTDGLPGLLASCLALLMILAIGMFHYLPREFAMIVVSWVMLSISVGISFGHCVLNEP
jgi:hypothetical protein